MGDPNQTLTEFKGLADEVAAGRLRLNDAAADRCAQACDRYIDGLITLKRRGRRLVRVDAFGDLGSAQALGEKFFNLAAGGGGSFEDVIQQHIDVATEMRDVFADAGAAYRASDEAHAATLSGVLPG